MNSAAATRYSTRHSMATGLLILALAWSGSVYADSEATVLITGSNRGIGLEFARQYAELGWRVIATCRTPDKADALQALADNYPNLIIEPLDITDHAAVDALADKYHGQAIDVLLNNAALLGPRADQAFGQIDYDLFERILAVNVIGTMKVSEAFVGNVAASGQKKIITLGSGAGSIQMLRAPPDFFPYRSSKVALHLLMRNLSLGLADRGIIVGLLNPGLVDTRGLMAIGPDDPVPDDFKQIMTLIRGGQLELITTEESVGALIPLIAELSPEQSGVFLNYDGNPVPW